jgi:hypothetical protein
MQSEKTHLHTFAQGSKHPQKDARLLGGAGQRGSGDVSGRATFLAGLGGDGDTQSTSATTAAVLSMLTDRDGMAHGTHRFEGGGPYQVDLTTLVAGAEERMGAGLGAPVDRGQGRRLRRGPQRRRGRMSMAAAPMADRRGAHGAAAADYGEGDGSTGPWRRPGGAHDATTDWGQGARGGLGLWGRGGDGGSGVGHSGAEGGRRWLRLRWRIGGWRTGRGRRIAGRASDRRGGGGGLGGTRRGGGLGAHGAAADWG